jgi:hypothetical protein
MAFKMMSFVFLALAVTSNGHTVILRGSDSLDANMRPEVVARTLKNVEDRWKDEAASFIHCSAANNGNCNEEPVAFSKSCATVVDAVVQGSSGDEKVAKEYMSNVCSQSLIKGWHQQHCVALQAALSAAMTADNYQNRNNFAAGKLCNKFWGQFVEEEKKRFVREEAERKEAEKKAAEEAERKAKEEAERQKKAKEEAEKKAKEEAEKAKKAKEEAEKKAAAEAARKKIEEAQRLKAEAQARATKAAEALAKKKAEAEEMAKQAQKKMEEAAEAEREHKKAMESLAKHETAPAAAVKEEKKAAPPAPVKSVAKAPAAPKPAAHAAENATKAASDSKLAVALDKDMKTKMVVKVQPKDKKTSFLSGIKDPCAGITCASNLKCPAGFSSTEIEGHCCPYCVNPNIKIEAAITGATGSNGGKASTFCPKVWCFPTLCTKAISNPTTTNGACCPTCPA